MNLVPLAQHMLDLLHTQSEEREEEVSAHPSPFQILEVLWQLVIHHDDQVPTSVMAAIKVDNSEPPVILCRD